MNPNPDSIIKYALKLGHNIKIWSVRIFDIRPSSCVNVTLKLAETSVLNSRPSVSYGVNLYPHGASDAWVLAVVVCLSVTR